jgi:hypothetical protein
MSASCRSVFNDITDGYFFSHENMKDFRSRGVIFSVTARFLHSSLFSFSFDRFSAAAFSCACSLAAGFAGGPIVKLWACAMVASGQVAAAPPSSVMNSRRCMSYPKLRRRHLSGSNEYFERGLKSISKPLPQCTANVADGSKADKPPPIEIDLCLLWSASSTGRRNTLS